MGSRRYNAESGQVFTEEVVGLGTLKRRQERELWEYQCLATSRIGRQAHAHDQPPPVGSKTLRRLCVEKVTSKADNLLPELLEVLPHHIAAEIWIAIRRGWRESFHVWTTFVRAGFGDQHPRHALNIKERYIYQPLVATFEKLSDPAGAWLTDLTLANVMASAADLKEVSRISNLQRLHIQWNRQNDSLEFDDCIVKAWAINSATQQSFAHLETLAMVNIPRITPAVFDDLAKFPSLAIVASAGCFGRKEASLRRVKQAGWCIANELSHRTHRASRITAEGTLETAGSASEAGWRWQSPPNFKLLVDEELLQLTRNPTTSTVDATIGLLVRHRAYDIPSLLMMFQRSRSRGSDTQSRVAEQDERPRKKRTLRQDKGAAFAAMLNGG